MMPDKQFRSILDALRLGTISPDQYHQLIDVIRAGQARKRDAARHTLRRLGPGARVQWNGRFGHQTGTLRRVLRKNAEVIESTTGLLWRVPMSMLEQV